MVNQYAGVVETRIYDNLNKVIISDPGWTLAYQDVYKPSNIKIIMFYEKGELIGILPLIKERTYGINIYQCVGYKFAHRSSILGDLSNPDFVTSLNEVINKLNAVRINRLTQYEYDLLQHGISNITLIQSVKVLYKKLEVDNNENLILKSKSHILRKARNEMAKLSIKVHSNQLIALEKVFSIDNRSRKHKRKYNVFSDISHQNFYKSLVKYMGRYLRINIMYNKTLPVSYEIGFINDRTYTGVEMAFLSGHEHYTPGKVMIVKLMELLAKQDFQYLDLGVGINDFKKSLTKDYQLIHDCIFIKNFIIRKYFLMCARTRENVYDFFAKRPRIYRYYRTIKLFIAK